MKREKDGGESGREKGRVEQREGEGEAERERERVRQREEERCLEGGEREREGGRYFCSLNHSRKHKCNF